MDTEDSKGTPATVETPVKVVDRRWWSKGTTGAAAEPARKPTYVEELERQLAEKDKAIQAHAARYRDSAAEFEQVRARLRRDVDRDVERARRALLGDFLEVADNLDRALASAEGADHALVKGLDLVRQLLLARLASHGVKPMEVEGQPFDPRLHEAVSVSSVDDPSLDETVRAVVRTGYSIGDEVLRPAGVVVGKLGAGG